MPLFMWIAVLILAWILTAPDPVTASVRSGAAEAIGSGARAAGQSVGADIRSAAARRSDAHRARLDEWADRDDLLGRALVELDRIFGRGGAVESAGRRIGAHGRAAVQAGRVGWQTGRAQGQRGLPAGIRTRTDPIVASARAAIGPALDTALGRSAPGGRLVTPASESSSAARGGQKEAHVAQQKMAELANTDTLRAEVKTLEADVEAASLAVLVLEKWTTALPERYASADFGTKLIGGAVQAAGESAKALVTARASVIALNEVLTQMRRALDAADQIGQVAAEQDAKGDVKGFQPA